MRLSDLIATLSRERLEDLAKLVVPGAADQEPGLWPHNLEIMLDRTGYIEQVILAQRPPVASVLLACLEAPDLTIDISVIQADVVAETSDWCARVTSGELANRVSESSRIYRKMLETAWENDHALDPSELRMLRILREQLGVFRMEHFLLAYHSSIQPSWQGENALERVVRDLQEAGVLFSRRDNLFALPEELVGHVRRSLGVSLGRGSARRLLERLDSGSHLKAALEEYMLPTSGSKAQRIERLIESFVPMDRVLDTMHIFEARDLVRALGLPVTGAKDELLKRILDHFSRDRDVVASEEPLAGPVSEPRVLSHDGFVALFSTLTLHQLQSTLSAFELRVSGTKPVRVATLWESGYSENTLLSKLKGPELDELLLRNGLPSRGSKTEKVSRLVERHQAPTSSDGAPDERGDADADVLVAVTDKSASFRDEMRAALVNVELSSKSPTRFEPLRMQLATRFAVGTEAIGIKYLADAKNHRNRIGEALRSRPEVLVLLTADEQLPSVIEAAEARIDISPTTVVVVYVGDEAGWLCRSILATATCRISARFDQIEPRAPLKLVDAPSAELRKQPGGLAARAQAELDVEWVNEAEPPETRVRIALARAFDRDDVVLRTKHISQARNIGNRVSEAIGAGCNAMVLVVPEALVEATMKEAARQLVGLREPSLAIVLSETEVGGYSRPAVVLDEGA